MPCSWSRLFRFSATNKFHALHSDTQGCLVCVAVLLLTVVRSGVTYSFGVFVVKLEELELAGVARERNSSSSGGEGKSAMALHNWIGTLSFSLSLTLSPVSVLLIRSIGAGRDAFRIVATAGVVILAASCLLSAEVVAAAAETHAELWLLLTYTILHGVGSSLTYMSSSLVIVDHYRVGHPRHVLATSSLMCGYPVGSLLFNPLNGWLVGSYGPSAAFRVCGCLILVVGLPCSLLAFQSAGRFPISLDDDEADDVVPADQGDFRLRLRAVCSPGQAAVMPEIGLWLLGNAISFVGFYMPFMNLQKGIGLADSKWVVAALSLAECVTYIAGSLIGDRLKGRLVTVNVASSAGLCLLCLAWPFIDNGFPEILACSMALGGLLGLSIVYQYAAFGEVTKLPIDIAWSATNMWSGFGILVGPLFSGVVYDTRKSFDDVWLVCGALYLTQLLLFSGILKVQQQRTADMTIAAVAAASADVDDDDKAMQQDSTVRLLSH